MGQAEILTVDPAAPDAAAIEHAAAALREGALVAFPTETVYGLGANARDPAAVARLFAAKQRPADNPLILHVGDLDGLSAVAARVPVLAAELATRFWPGPLTLVVDADPALPPAARGGLATVAVRLPDHPVAVALLRAATLPIAAPSANRSGRPSPTTAGHVLDDLGAHIDLVVDGGPCRVGVESTVVDARGIEPIVLREGAVTREQLGAGAPASARLQAASPGTRHRHYAPDCRVEVTTPGQGRRRVAELAAQGLRVGSVGPVPAPPPAETLAVCASADELARELYAALRRAEERGLDVVVIEGVEEGGLGRAVMDRLRRAAAS